jgi:hypothetical protein
MHIHPKLNSPTIFSSFSFCSAGDGTHGRACTRQDLYHWATSPAHSFFFYTPIPICQQVLSALPSEYRQNLTTSAPGSGLDRAYSFNASMSLRVVNPSSTRLWVPLTLPLTHTSLPIASQICWALSTPGPLHLLSHMPDMLSLFYPHGSFPSRCPVLSEALSTQLEWQLPSLHQLTSSCT